LRSVTTGGSGALFYRPCNFRRKMPICKITRVLLGILTLIPCIGLIVLLVVNGKATGILKQNGIKVGLLGANLSQI